MAVQERSYAVSVDESRAFTVACDTADVRQCPSGFFGRPSWRSFACRSAFRFLAPMVKGIDVSADFKFVAAETFADLGLGVILSLLASATPRQGSGDHGQDHQRCCMLLGEAGPLGRHGVLSCSSWMYGAAADIGQGRRPRAGPEVGGPSEPAAGLLCDRWRGVVGAGAKAPVASFPQSAFTARHSRRAHLPARPCLTRPSG